MPICAMDESRFRAGPHARGGWGDGVLNPKIGRAGLGLLALALVGVGVALIHLPSALIVIGGLLWIDLSRGSRTA